MKRRLLPWMLIFCVAAIGLSVSGCANVVPATSAVDVNTVAAAPTEIRLAPGDKIHVTVFGEKELTGDYEIDTGGYVALPLAGSVKAAGLTPPQLEEALTKQFKSSYLRHPKVTVEVLTFRPFYVLGEVRKPGEYRYRSGLNVLSAIATAGGTTYRASQSKVYIQRAGTTDLKEYPQSPAVSVMPGDLVRVPQRYF